MKLNKLRKELGRDLQMATEMEIHNVFKDCAVGAIPPLGPAYRITTIWDDSIMEQPDIYFEAGDHEQLVHLKMEDFVALLGDSSHGRFSSRM